MSNGFKICDGNEYQFLSYTMSSLKTHGTWFLKVNSEITKENIYQMGDFEKEKAVSMRHSRIGQLFTTTSNSLNL